MTPPLRVIVVDDEPIAREGLAALLVREAIVPVALCGSRDEAVASINGELPDVVFLDVELSPGTGFEVVERMRAPRTQVVFVTAYDHHAVQAFTTAALDYIVKPVDPDRLRLSIARARERLRQASAAPPLPLVFPDGNQSLLFEAGDIRWIEGAGDYASLHARSRTWLVTETLDSLEQRLPFPPFLRCHRSAIVNLSQVTRLTRVSRYRRAAILRDGQTVPVSAGRIGAIEERLGIGDKSA
jgi:two-component system, LytTR family, response regulator